MSATSYCTSKRSRSYFLRGRAWFEVVVVMYLCWWGVYTTSHPSLVMVDISWGNVLPPSLPLSLFPQFPISLGCFSGWYLDNMVEMPSLFYLERHLVDLETCKLDQARHIQIPLVPSFPAQYPHTARGAADVLSLQLFWPIEQSDWSNLEFKGFECINTECCMIHSWSL